MKLSHKDFILLIGILVAAAIALSTWMYGGAPSKANVSKPLIKKETLNEATSMVFNRLIKKTQSPASCNSN